MVRVIWILWVFLITGNVHGQSDSAFMMMEDFTKEMETTFKKISFATKSGKPHNLYVDQEWQHSFLVAPDQSIIHFNGRYNILNKSVELIYKGQIRTINPTAMVFAKIGQHVFAPLFTDDGPEYFEFLSSGQVDLLLKYGMSENMRSSNSLVSQVVGETVYEPSEELYFRKNGKIDKLKTSRNRVMELFTGHSSEVEAFVEERNTKFKRKDDLVRVFNFFNSLESNHLQSP